jgi:electron transfer flavoprotein beta subunit
VLDESSAVALEVALRLIEADAAGGGAGGEVLALSMTPGGDLGGVRSALAMGAGRAITVTDDALAGADALTTAKVLAAAAAQAAPLDLVVAGTESTDGYAGVLLCQMAALLGLPAVTFARAVSVSGGVVGAERQTEHGIEEVACPLPCVLTVTSGAVSPRYPSYKAIVGARSKPVDVLSLDDLGVALGPPAQEVVEALPAASRVPGEVVDDEGQGHERILELLVHLKVV